MSRRVGIIVLIVAAGILVLGVLATFTAPVQVIGSYPIPDGGRAASAIDLPGTRVALRVFGTPYNYYEFDCATLQFVNPQYLDHPDIETDKIGWICWGETAVNLGLDFANEGRVGIGSRGTGQLLFDFTIDDEMPFLYGGTANGTEIMVVILEHHGKTHFLNLSQPGFLGTVTWPEDYQTPRFWATDIGEDYISRHGLHSYSYNSLTQTLFVPVSHLGLVYWCQIDLSGGFNYSFGTIACGSRPQFVIQSADGTAIYVFDDETNQVFTVNPFTKQITGTAQFESPSYLGKTIYHQGFIYFALAIPPQRQDIHRVVRMDPATGSTIDATLTGQLIMDMDAYGNSICVLQHDENDNCHIRELSATDLQLLDDIVVGDEDTIRLLADQPSGRMVVADKANDRIIVVQF